MILELAWMYVPVVVVLIFWVVAMRPLLRIIHLSAVAGRPGAMLPAVTPRVPRR